MESKGDNDVKFDDVGKRPVTIAKASKQPPPEKPENIYIRSLVILSFWAVVIFLGVPIWLWTTSIYRARLPLEEMLAWADGKVRDQTLLL